MPSLLGPTNPVPGYEPQPVKVTVPPPGDTSVQNIVDPNRVVRPDGKTERQDTGDSTGAARYESNYMTFLQRLRSSRDLPETFMRLLQWQNSVTSGIREGFAKELSEFLEFLKMDEGQLLDFLRNQLQSGSRFSGALFQLLRDAAAGGQSDFLRSEILQFLRRYSDYTSTDHLEGKILRFTEEMRDSLPSQWADRCGEILAKLQNGVAAGDREGNLNLLRGELFPLISRYVSTTHDHGRARALLSMLALDVARYENGSPEGLVRSFRALTAGGVFPQELGRLSDEEILRLLREGEFFKSSQNNQFAGHLADLTSRALRGEGGPGAQEAFQNIMASVLVNESVYMPLSHAMIPLNWNGNRMFAEMWVDPDAEDEAKRGGGGERTLRILIKMDVESLGAFDLLFNAKGEQVSLSVACPESVAPFMDAVGRSMGEILKRNGLNVEEVRVARMRRAAAVSDAFPKLFKNRSGVNVRV